MRDELDRQISHRTDRTCLAILLCSLLGGSLLIWGVARLLGGG